MKLAALALAVAMPVAVTHMSAQTSLPSPIINSQHPGNGQSYPIHNYQLHYATSQAEQNEILTAIRVVAAQTGAVFLVPSLSQIVFTGTPEQNEQVLQLLHMLDVPAPLYRLTYIFTESENGKRIGIQQYSMVLASGQRMQLKEGDRVPVMTGSTAKDTGGVSKQATYLDVGFNFDSTVSSYGPDAVRLQAKVERSAVAMERTSLIAEDPLIRQSMLSGVANLTLNKPQHLGNIDVIGTTRQLQVDALVELVK